MMELLNEVIEVRCEGCNQVICINNDCFDIESSDYDHGDNCMGNEVVHEINYEMQCPICNNYIRMYIWGSEYPYDAFNHEGRNIWGGSFVDIPHMGIVYFQDDFETCQWAVEATGVKALIMRINSDPSLLFSIKPREFEQVVEQLFRDAGFSTILTPAIKDGGKDIIAVKKGQNSKPIVLFIECKRYAKTNKVDVSIVRSLFGVQIADRVDKACLVTSSVFTKDAREFAKRKNVMMDLVDGNELRDMIKRSANMYMYY